MKIQKLDKIRHLEIKKVFRPPVDLDPGTDVSWEVLLTSSKHTAFPIYGISSGHIRKGNIVDLDEIVFTGPDAVNRPMQVISQNHFWLQV